MQTTTTYSVQSNVSGEWKDVYDISNKRYDHPTEKACLDFKKRMARANKTLEFRAVRKLTTYEVIEPEVGAGGGSEASSQPPDHIRV